MKKAWKISGLALVTVILVSLVSSCKVQTFSCKQIHKEDIEEFANDTTERFLFDWSGEQENTILDISHVNAHATKCPKVHFSIEGDTLFVTEKIRKSANKKASWKYSIPIGDKTYLVVKTDAKQVFPIMKTEGQKSFQVFATRCIRGDGKHDVDKSIIGKWELIRAHDEDGYLYRYYNHPCDKYGKCFDKRSNLLPGIKLYVNPDYTWQYYEDDVLKDCGIITLTSKKNITVCYKYYDVDIDILKSCGEKSYTGEECIYLARKAKDFKSRSSKNNIGRGYEFSIPLALFWGCFKNQRTIYSISEDLTLTKCNEDECFDSITGNTLFWQRIK